MPVAGMGEKFATLARGRRRMREILNRREEGRGIFEEEEEYLSTNTAAVWSR